MDFHGDTNHAKMSRNFKMDTYRVLWSLTTAKHHRDMTSSGTNQNELKYLQLGYSSLPLLRRALNPKHVSQWGTPQGWVIPARERNPGPTNTPRVGIIEAPPRLSCGQELPKNYVQKQSPILP